jgi:hypothetical protein
MSRFLIFTPIRLQMRTVLLLSLFLLTACASRPDRFIASSEPVAIAEIDAKRSMVKLFTSDSGQPDLNYFYFELRDSKKALVDVELKDIVIQESEINLHTRVRRISLGRYEAAVEKDLSDMTKVKFLIQNKKLAHKLVNLQKPNKKQSTLVLLSDSNNDLSLRLTLRDRRNLPVEMQQSPEIILEGIGEVSGLKMVKAGVWEFTISYPEVNQILYVSLRANGVKIERLFRFQHVEK